MKQNDIYNKPNFVGTVVDIWDSGVLVLVNSDEEAYRSSDKISVSLDDTMKDSLLEIKKGDKIKVFYDGTILESYPAQIHKPYKILKIVN